MEIAARHPVTDRRENLRARSRAGSAC